MPKITIDGNEIEVEEGITIIQACEQAGVEIPRFCYHERLEIAGNCRMCLVEVKPGPPKPQASCALPVAEGMEILTDSPMVRRAREGVMEFLLINHPLDCPICDQGGECDLQDQAMAYGAGYSRYAENKRAVADKYMGPLIKTHMTRCIHCTRCVRFADEIAGVPELGAIGRGEHTEITTGDKPFHSELSGNIIDLCPVGALTSRPYAFKARPWELKKTETIDVHDAMGSNIRVDVRGNAVLRVMPRLNEEINEEWLGDKSRFACDGLRVQRLDKPYIRRDGKLQPASWEEALELVAEKMRATAPEAMGAIAGNLLSVEAMYALKDLFVAFGSGNYDCRQDAAIINSNNRADYLFNSTIAGIEDADFILLIGSNPRVEAPVLNARIRKHWLATGLPIYALGPQVPLTYPVSWLGEDVSLLLEIADGKAEICKQLKKAKRPMLIIGQGALMRDDGTEIHALAKQIAKDYEFVSDQWNGFNILHVAASRVGGLDIGFVPDKDWLDVTAMLEGSRQGNIELLYLLAADEIDMGQIGAGCFVIYQGHHGDVGAHRADIVLPSAAYTEQDGIYVNMEGRPQKAYRAAFPPGEAKEDWKIIRAISQYAGKELPYNSQDELREQIYKTYPHLADTGAISAAKWHKAKPRKRYLLNSAPLSYAIKNYYMTDSISRQSKTMAECVAAFGSSVETKQEAA